MDQISFSIDAFLVRGPIKFLEDELKEKRFLEGVDVSVTYFERFGLEKLSDYFKSKGVPVEPLNLERLKIPAMTRMLERFGIIDNKTHSRMIEVNQVRNKIVHPHTVHGLKDPDAINGSEAKKAIETAIECLKALGVT
jgi:hypothetical protein